MKPAKKWPREKHLRDAQKELAKRTGKTEKTWFREIVREEVTEVRPSGSLSFGSWVLSHVCRNFQWPACPVSH